MVNVVDYVFVSSNLPKYLLPLSVEIGKAKGYAFENDELLERFIHGCQEEVSRLSQTKKSILTCNHTASDSGGSIVIGKADMMSSDFLRLSYLKLKGHLQVSRDNCHLVCEPFTI